MTLAPEAVLLFPAPPPLQHTEPFLPTCGNSASSPRARDLDAPFRGVRVRRDTVGAALHGEDTPDEIARRNILGRVRAHALVLPPPAFYTGTTALAIHGLPFPDADAAASADLDVAVPAPHRALRRTGITAVQISPMLVHTTVRAGLPVATPASAWAMLAREHTIRDLVVIGDAIIRVPRDGWGRRLPEAQHAGPEKLTAAAAAGRRCGIEGDHHRTSRRQWVRDLEKYSDYATLRWDVVRLSAAHIRHDPSRGVALVRAALARRGWHA